MMLLLLCPSAAVCVKPQPGDYFRGRTGLLNDYCSLCLLRFGNLLSYEINCSEEFKSLSMPKLLLQPLVENAVIHGIEPSEVPCKLFVEAERHGNSLYILIEDDGVGFKEEELNSRSPLE